MTRLILRALNAPGLVLLVTIGIALQTSLFHAWPLRYFQPDFVLFAVIWVALKRGFAEGGVLTLFMADIAELHSAAPQGLFLIAYMTIFLLTRGVARLVVMPNVSSVSLLTVMSSVVWRVTCWSVLYFLGTSSDQWLQALLVAAPAAFIAGALAPWAYRSLDKFDKATFKSARAEAAVEGELQLEGEGF